MNKELLNEHIESTEIRNPGMETMVPGSLSPSATAKHLVDLLQAMYVEHGITKNKEKLISEIEAGNVLTWFAKKNEKFVATASLIKQSDNSWELGRAVSVERGTGIGKNIILKALEFHIDNHTNSPLTAEVRAAADFKGVPSGIATQNIFLGLINDIVPITPFAIAPLFAHGTPLRNETFILSATDIQSEKTVSEKISESINGRSTQGNLQRLRVIHTVPFRLVVPNDEGSEAFDVSGESANFSGCTLFPIEATDMNMPLIGMLLTDPTMIACGIDRAVGKESKPVILIATLGKSTELAPTLVSDIVPQKMREDLQNIANRFGKSYSGVK